MYNGEWRNFYYFQLIGYMNGAKWFGGDALKREC